MKLYYVSKIFKKRLKKSILIIFWIISNSFVNGQNISLQIHLNGVYESNIRLIPISGNQQFKTITEVQGLHKNESSNLLIEEKYLPGEFSLQFSYKEIKEGLIKNSERRILINKQNLEIWLNPIYCKTPDSIRFQKDELENNAFAMFLKESSSQKEGLGVLHQFLMNYDDTKSNFYYQGILEYEKRRLTYNSWISSKVKTDKKMFVSSIYNFSFVPNIPWEGSQSERKASMISHYFDGIDFNDPIITRTSQINEFMNGYVNLNAQGAVNQALRDSLIPLSAKNAIEKAKQGNPVVYGWMVDYFYRGFESNNLPSGMKVLEPYLNDTKCLTSKRMEIERRLKGMESLVVGSIAPNIQLKDTDGQLFDLEKQKFEEKYTLLLFWSADCSHCIETVDGIYPWLKQPEINQKVRTIAISLDETETEVNAWEKKISELTGWKHLRASEGVRSKVAGNYFILATPVMILMDSRTKEIKGIPGTLRELNELIH